MGYTKRQFAEGALEEIGMAAYVFDAQPEQLQSILRRIDAMMAEWNAKGIRLGYPLPSSPEASDIDAETNVPDSAYETIICNAAVRISPMFGKTPSSLTMRNARRGYGTVLGKAAQPQEMQFLSMPLGAGNKAYPYGRVFTTGPVPGIDAGPDGELEFN